MREVGGQRCLVLPELVDLDASVDHGVGGEAVRMTARLLLAGGFLQRNGGGQASVTLLGVKVDRSGDDDHVDDIN